MFPISCRLNSPSLCLPSKLHHWTFRRKLGCSCLSHIVRLTHPDSIRLFQLQNVPDVQELSGEVISARPSNKPKYFALSYMGGSENHDTDVPLRLNGHILSIRSNLAAALRSLQVHQQNNDLFPNNDLPPKQSYLWIDLICVRQYDTREKNHQVQQMETSIAAQRQSSFG